MEQPEARPKRVALRMPSIPRRAVLLVIVAGLLLVVGLLGPVQPPTTPPLVKPRVAKARKTAPAAESSTQLAASVSPAAANAAVPNVPDSTAASGSVEPSPQTTPAPTDTATAVPAQPAEPSEFERKLPPSYATLAPAKPGTLQSPMEALREGEEPQVPVPTNISSKIRRYAEVVVSQFDTDNDGRLSATEYAAMPGDPSVADLNGDGMLEAQEIAARVAVYSRRRLIRLMPGPVNPVAADPAAPEATAPSTSTSGPSAAEAELAKRARQFYVPDRNLPTGLPEWFLASDTNGDAQISMAEFSARWSGTELHRFDQYDTDHDGLITTTEGQKIGAGPNAAEPQATDAAALK